MRWGVAQRGQSGGVGAADVVGPSHQPRCARPEGDWRPSSGRGGPAAVRRRASQRRGGRSRRRWIRAARGANARRSASSVRRRGSSGTGRGRGSSSRTGGAGAAPRRPTGRRPVVVLPLCPYRRGCRSKIDIRVRHAEPYIKLFGYAVPSHIRCPGGPGALAGPTGYLIPRNGDS